MVTSGLTKLLIICSVFFLTVLEITWREPDKAYTCNPSAKGWRRQGMKFQATQTYCFGVFGGWEWYLLINRTSVWWRMLKNKYFQLNVYSSLFLNEKLHFFSICFVQFGSLELWKTLFRTFPSGWNSPLCSTGHTLGGEALKPSASEWQPRRKPIFLQAALTCRVPQYSSINTAGQVSVGPFPFLPSSATVTNVCFVCVMK